MNSVILSESPVVQAARLVPTSRLNKFRDHISPLLTKDHLDQLTSHIHERSSYGPDYASGHDLQKTWVLVRELACFCNGIEVDEDMKDTRRQDIVLSRYMAIAAMRREYRLTLVALGEHYKRDHATALHGIRKIMEYLMYDKDRRALILDFADRLMARGFGRFELWCRLVLNGQAAPLVYGDKVYKHGIDRPYYYITEDYSGYVCSRVTPKKSLSVREAMEAYEMITIYFEEVSDYEKSTDKKKRKSRKKLASAA